MTQHTAIECPLCGGNDTSHFTDCTDHAVSNETYSLQRCGSCGLIFTIAPPDSQDKQTYSKLDQELNRADNPRKRLDRLYYYARILNIRRKIRLIERLTRVSSGKLLNYGAKSGYFSSRMTDRGWKVTSLEEYHEQRIFSLEMFHHRMMDIDEIDSLPPGSFDAVTLWHTLEHQEDPHTLIEKLIRLLKPNGLLFAAVPNTDSLDAAWYGSQWAAWDVPRHLLHFNTTSMIRFGLAHNLVLMHHERMPFEAFYIPMLSEKFKGNRHPIITGAVRGLKFWHKTNTDREKSSSIVYVFRKNMIDYI